MPLSLLASLLMIWATTMVIDRRFRRRRAARVGAIGRAARMNYAAVDRFGLHGRLLHAPGWSDMVADLEVKDVLYGSAGGERCFIFTAKSRRSYDAEGVRRVARVIESVRNDDASLGPLELVAHDSADAHADGPIYQELVEGWRARHPHATAPRKSGDPPSRVLT